MAKSAATPHRPTPSLPFFRTVPGYRRFPVCFWFSLLIAGFFGIFYRVFLARSGGMGILGWKGTRWVFPARSAGAVGHRVD